MSLNQIINDGSKSADWKNLRCNNLVIDGALSIDSDGLKSVEAALGGFNTNPDNTATLQYQKIGNMATVIIPRIIIDPADQQTGVLDIFGLPSDMRPSQDVYKVVAVRDGNDIVSTGTMRINSTNAEIQVWLPLQDAQSTITAGASSGGLEFTVSLTYLTV